MRMSYSNYILELSNQTGLSSASLVEQGLAVSYDSYHYKDFLTRKAKIAKSKALNRNKERINALKTTSPTDRAKGLLIMSDLIPMLKAQAAEKQILEDELDELDQLMDFDDCDEGGGWA